jgi:hypothetical protein
MSPDRTRSPELPRTRGKVLACWRGNLCHAGLHAFAFTTGNHDLHAVDACVTLTPGAAV